MTKPKVEDSVGWETWHKHFCSSCYIEFDVLCPGKESNPNHSKPSLCPKCQK